MRASFYVVVCSDGLLWAQMMLVAMKAEMNQKNDPPKWVVEI